MSEEWISPPRPTRWSGDERCEGVAVTVRPFWSYAMSDLLMNNVRGYLPESLVAKAAGSTRSRVEWGAYDVLTREGIGVEVKSAGYLQAWNQRKLSRISFGSMKGHTWTPEERGFGVATFNADVYVFAIETATRHEDYRPLDVSQWEFYSVSRAPIESTDYRSIGLPTLRRLSDGPVPYRSLGDAIRAIGRQVPDGEVLS